MLTPTIQEASRLKISLLFLLMSFVVLAGFNKTISIPNTNIKTKLHFFHFQGSSKIQTLIVNPIQLPIDWVKNNNIETINRITKENIKGRNLLETR